MHRYDENLTESVTCLYLRKKTNEVIYINFNDMQVSARSLWYTVEALQFKVAQFLWCSWAALPHTFTSTKNSNLESVKLKFKATTKLHPHE